MNVADSPAWLLLDTKTHTWTAPFPPLWLLHIIRMGRWNWVVRESGSLGTSMHTYRHNRDCTQLQFSTIDIYNNICLWMQFATRLIGQPNSKCTNITPTFSMHSHVLLNYHSPLLLNSSEVGWDQASGTWLSATMSHGTSLCSIVEVNNEPVWLRIVNPHWNATICAYLKDFLTVTWPSFVLSTW